LVIVIVGVMMAGTFAYIAAPQLYIELYWLTHQYHEHKPGSGGGAMTAIEGAMRGEDATTSIITNQFGGGGEPVGESDTVVMSRGRRGASGGGGASGGPVGSGGGSSGKRRSVSSSSLSSRRFGGGGSSGTSISSSSSSSSFRSSHGALRRKSLREKVGSDEARRATPKVYDVGVTCWQHWRNTVQKLLHPWADGVHRESMTKVPLETVSHTGMWLRVVRGKLHCVLDPRMANLTLRLKPYRARHYIQRVNAILKSGKRLPENLEWWTHHSDWSKVPKGIGLVDGLPPPVMATSGGLDFWDIPGVPFMSFSDVASVNEKMGYKEVKSGMSFDERWKRKKAVAFFLGALSDCADAMKNHADDHKWCARAKVVKYGAELAQQGNDLLSGVRIYNTDGSVQAMLKGCDMCVTPKLKGQAFVRELMNHKFVLNFDGAGNWSRRMSLLLNSGSVVLKAESAGYQFYEYGLEPGVHYVPFDAMVGKEEQGNLLPRLEWLAEFDDVAKEVAQRAESFGEACLSEHSVNDFVYEMLAGYGRLQRGRPAKYDTVDISECFDRKSCRNKLEPCFPATFGVGGVGGSKGKKGLRL